MQQLKIVLSSFLFAILILASCSSDDTNTISLEFNGLENLGTDYAYEGWLIVNGNPVSTGVFNINDSGVPTSKSFEVSSEDAALATAFVLTIEPSPDNDPAPTDVHILAGDFNNGNTALTVSHPAALGNDFSSARGAYILATPTDGGSDTNENSGVWWLDPSLGPGPGLDLPTLPAGWAYEGWAVIDGTPVSTGTFTSANGADSFNGFSGNAGGPPYPGEDLLTNAPNGLDFPIDLAGKTVVISIEPVPDNSSAPFTLKPLVGVVPNDAIDHTTYNMANNAVNTNPTGSLTSNR